VEPLLRDEQLARAQDHIYRHGRLLERLLYAHFFEGGSREACLAALRAYQNPDGGFGNGLEPDLLCPDSTMIGAETALVILDLLDASQDVAVDGTIEWIEASLNSQGTIEHPPEAMARYQHQPWWENPDGQRILALAGLLRRMGRASDALLRRVRPFYETTDIADYLTFYGYPLYVYLKHCAEGEEDQRRLAQIVRWLPTLLEQFADHYPLFGRHWHEAANDLSPEVVQQEAQRFVDALQPDGGLVTPYPDLPWWRPMWTLDGLILLRKRGWA